MLKKKKKQKQKTEKSVCKCSQQLYPKYSGKVPSPLDTKYVLSLPTPILILWHQCNVWQFNSDANFWGKCQTPQVEEECPHFRHQPHTGHPSYSHFCLNNYKFRGSYTPLCQVRFNKSLQQLTELRKALTTTGLLKRIYLRKSQIQEICKANEGKGVQGASMPSPGTSLSQAFWCVHWLKSSPILSLGNFMIDQITIGDWTPISSLFPLPRGWGVGLKALTL